MKRSISVFAVALMFCLLCAPAVAHADESNIYAPFDSFSELYDAYVVAAEDGDEDTIAWLEDIGKSSLQAEIESAETAPQPRPYVRDYFDYAEFRGTSVSNANLAMMPKGNYKYAWSDYDKNNGWITIQWNFQNDYRWSRPNAGIMKEQFYCHARLVYSVIAGEWNLEPWRTSMNPFTCN